MFLQSNLNICNKILARIHQWINLYEIDLTCKYKGQPNKRYEMKYKIYLCIKCIGASEESLVTHLLIRLRLLTHVRFFSKTWSDNFRSVLTYGNEQESREKIFHNRAKIIHFPENV